MRKAFALLTIVMVLTTLLAACGGGAACEDEFGCVEVAKDEPIRIAYSFVLSGPDASLGEDTKRGVEMAAEEVQFEGQDVGMIQGHPIEVIGEDSLCTPEGGQTAAQKLAADPKIAGVVGTNCSSAARAHPRDLRGQHPHDLAFEHGH